MTGRLWSVACATATSLRRRRDRLLRRLDRPVLILLYHRVTTLAVDPHALAVSPPNFRAQLSHLRSAFPIVGLEEDWRGADRPAVAVTFDDGYADNVLEALPILEELGVPATFFVTTGAVESGATFPWDEPSAAADRAAHRPMTVDELRRLAASPCATIGAHTVTHPALSSLPPREQREEILASKRQLEAWTGAPVRLFAYPYGFPSSFDRTSRKLCEEAGFLRAAANHAGQAYRWTDPFQLPRQLVRNWPADEFARRLEEFWEP